MKNLHLVLTGLAILDALIATQRVAADDTMHIIPVTFENKNLRPLGSGYDSRSQRLYNKCVDNPAPVGSPVDEFNHQNPIGSFSLDIVKAEQGVEKSLGISADGRYRTGVTTISASAAYAKDSKSNEFSLAYNYMSEHYFQSTMEPEFNRPIVPMPGFANMVTNSFEFYNRCGDEYVFIRDHAARLLVNINVSFVSKHEKESFKAKFGIDSPVISFASDAAASSDEFSASNTMKIRVLQIGGDPGRVGQVLCPKNMAGIPDPECAQNAMAVVNCTFGTIKNCTSLLSAAIAYANAADGENFPSQIRDGKNYAVVSLATIPFVSLGNPFRPPPTAVKLKELTAEIKMVSEIFESQYALWNFSDSLYTGRAPRLSIRQKNEMEKIRNLHFQNLSAAATALENCYDHGYDICKIEYDTLRTKIGLDKDGGIQATQYSAIIELTNPENLVQYCDLADNDHPGIAMTIQTLKTYALNILKEQSAQITKGDVCANLDMWFQAQTVLDLTQYPSLEIGDLEPIGLLPNLIQLKLRGKNLVDISPLKNLTRLEELDLDENEIVDLKPLGQLHSLKTLSVQNNRLNGSALAPLARLEEPNGKLHSVDARGNAEDLTCSFKDKSRCKLLDFSKSFASSIMYDSCEMRIGHQAVPIAKERVLVTGGYSMNGISYFRSDIQVVGREGCNPVSGQLSIARAGHSMTVLKDGRILVAGGHTDRIEFVDPVNLSSKLGTQSMNTIRTEHTATLLSDGRVLVVGGYKDPINYNIRSTNISASVEIISPNGSIEYLGEMSLPRAEHTATLLSGDRVLILGGYSVGKMIGPAEVIDVKSKTIRFLDEDLPVPRTGHTALKMQDGKVIIVGGYEWGLKFINGKNTPSLAATGSIVIFDPETETFDEVSDSLDPAVGSLKAAEMSDGRVLLISGERAGAYFTEATSKIDSVDSSIRLYDPDTRSIYILGHLSLGRMLFTLSPISNRSLMVVGGAGEPGASTSAELIVYRPKTK